MTVENISNLVKFVLEEFEILKREYLFRKKYLEEHIKDKKRRLDKLFDLLETSDALDLTDITPRIIMRTKNDPDKRN